MMIYLTNSHFDRTATCEGRQTDTQIDRQAETATVYVTLEQLRVIMIIYFSQKSKVGKHNIKTGISIVKLKIQQQASFR